MSKSPNIRVLTRHMPVVPNEPLRQGAPVRAYTLLKFPAHFLSAPKEIGYDNGMHVDDEDILAFSL